MTDIAIRPDGFRDPTPPVAALLAAIVESSVDAIISENLDGVVLSWNAAAERLFGYKAAEMIGRPIVCLFPPELVEEEASILERLRHGESLEGYESVRVTKDGRRLDVALTISPVRDASGAIVGAAKIVRDLTEHKHNQRQFEILADLMPTLCWMANADGWIFWYNRRWYEYTGTTPEQMQGWGWQSVHDPALLSTVLVQWKGSIASGQNFEMTFPLKGADGVFRPFLTRISPVRGADGLVSRWLGVNTDVSAERAATQLRENFMAVLGHDLRNPLSAILSGVTLLRKTPLSDRAQTLAAMMESSAARMSALVGDLLDLSRIRLGGGLGLERAAQNLEPLLRQTITELATASPERRIEATFNLDGPVDCDGGRVAQLFSNLLGNALTYGAPDKPVSVRAKSSAEGFELSVANAGKPIPSADMERLFQPFQRGEKRPSRQGLGLGLYIAHEVARAHGGTLDVVSTREETRFTFRMPNNKLPA